MSSPRTSTTKKCPMCAEEIKLKAKICHFCGAEFEVTVRGYCTNCHTVIDANESGKCKNCLRKIVDQRVESRLIPEAIPQAATSEAPAKLISEEPQRPVTDSQKPQEVPIMHPKMELKSISGKTDLCANCGRRAGQTYRYHYGWQTAQDKSNTDLLVARFTSTTTTYRIGGVEEISLCNYCISHFITTGNVIVRALVCFILAFALIGIEIILSQDTTPPCTILAVPLIALLLILIGTLPLFPKKVTQEKGEQAAINRARKKNLHGSNTVFWTTKEYEELKRR